MCLVPKHVVGGVVGQCANVMVLKLCELEGVLHLMSIGYRPGLGQTASL